MPRPIRRKENQIDAQEMEKGKEVQSSLLQWREVKNVSKFINDENARQFDFFHCGKPVIPLRENSKFVSNCSLNAGE